MASPLRMLAAGLVALLACEGPGEPSGAGGLGLQVISVSSAATLDSGRVILEGPTDTIVRATPGSTVTILGLAPGTYTVTLEGFVGSEVDHFGRKAGVQVVAGQNAAVTVTFDSFRPALGPPTLTPDGLQFVVSFPAVPAADSYRVEVAATADFAGADGSVVTGPSAQFAIDHSGAYFIRARAFDPFLLPGRLSDPVAVTITAIGSTAGLDGSARDDGTAYANGGGPIVGDFEDFGLNRREREFYSFDLVPLPPAVTVSSAVLRLFQAVVAGSPYVALGDVIVDHLDYQDFLDGTDFLLAPLQANIGRLSVDAAIEYKTLDVTAAVRDDLAAGRPHSQFRLRFSNFDGNSNGISDYAAFGDAELSCCITDSPPELVLIYR